MQIHAGAPQPTPAPQQCEAEPLSPPVPCVNSPVALQDVGEGVAEPGAHRRFVWVEGVVVVGSPLLPARPP